MPIFIAALWGAFLTVLPSLVGRVLIALGIGVLVYTGVRTTLGWLKTNALSNFSLLPADVLGMLATMRVGEALNIVFSAIIVRLVLNGLQSDVVKRWTTN